jgi:hypothetical protein
VGGWHHGGARSRRRPYGHRGGRADTAMDGAACCAHHGRTTHPVEGCCGLCADTLRRNHMPIQPDAMRSLRNRSDGCADTVHTSTWRRVFVADIAPVTFGGETSRDTPAASGWTSVRSTDTSSNSCSETCGQECPFRPRADAEGGGQRKVSPCWRPPGFRNPNGLHPAEPQFTAPRLNPEQPPRLTSVPSLRRPAAVEREG